MQPVAVQTMTTIVVDGKAYARPKDMPPELCARYAAKLRALAAMGIVSPR